MVIANVNGQPWHDDQGALIQAHGGSIVPYEGEYFWYGEDKGVANIAGTSRVPFVGIGCYRSTDLLTWHRVGDVLTAASDPSQQVQAESIVERPKVLFNAQTKQFVMWCHFDTPDYRFAGCLVATAKQPTGPFTVQQILRPNNFDSRDMTLYEENGQAYLVHSANMNKTLYVANLAPDYLGVTGEVRKLFIDQEREAPVIFHEGEWYFTITSGTTGWRPNPALFSRSHFLVANQKLIDNPCEGPKKATTYDGQPTFGFQYQGQWYLLLDHWQREDLQHSGYSILPIEIHGRDLVVPWVDQPLQLNTAVNG